MITIYKSPLISSNRFIVKTTIIRNFYRFTGNNNLISFIFVIRTCFIEAGDTVIISSQTFNSIIFIRSSPIFLFQNRIIRIAYNSVSDIRFVIISPMSAFVRNIPCQFNILTFISHACHQVCYSGRDIISYVYKYFSKSAFPFFIDCFYRIGMFSQFYRFVSP